MKVELLADGVCFGTVEATILDAAMGVVGGSLQALPVYYTRYQALFRTHAIQPDWASLEALKLLAISDSIGILNPTGGIGITDVADFEEVTVEIAGLSAEAIRSF